MDTQTTNMNNWLEDEAKKMKQPQTYEELPSLKLSPNVITDITIDFSKPFNEWTGEDGTGKPISKRIIPVTCNGVKMNWWLNVKNPLYSQIILSGLTGQTAFKILQTGTQKATKYVIVK